MDPETGSTNRPRSSEAYARGRGEHEVTDSPSASGWPTSANEVVDELLPEGLDWVRLVRSYPLTSLTVALVGGFLLGRRHGPTIVNAVSRQAGDYVARGVEGLVDAGFNVADQG